MTSDSAEAEESLPSRPPNMADVAQRAGVSAQTVSRVINGHKYVSASARARVESAIRSLGYRPNRSASALASGRSNTVTVLASSVTLFGYARTLQGIEEAAKLRGVGVALSSLGSGDPEFIKRTVDGVSDPRSGSVIVIAYDAVGAAALRALPPDVPFAAAFGRSFSAGRVKPDPRWVWLNDFEAAREATAHLLGLGHRTVHYVPIPSWTQETREGGWRQALLDAGAGVPPVARAGWDARAGYEAASQLDPNATAVLCGNDDLALGLMRGLSAAGRSVPGDVSVIGFDDAPQSEYLMPSLSTVRLDFVGLGRAAFEVVHGQVTDAPIPTETRPAQPELILRESTAPPRT